MYVCYTSYATGDDYMMRITKAYVFRMYPNEKQINLIEKSFGCSRFIYNHFLETSNNYLNKYDCIKQLPLLERENVWLKEVDSCLLRCSIFNLENGFKRYNNKLGGKPNFKSKNTSRQSYRTNNISSVYKGREYNSISIDLDKSIIKLPKLKSVSIRGYRNLKSIDGRVINATIYKEAGKYYVSVCVESYVVIPNIVPTKIVGIDLGIKDLVITSNGEYFGNKKYIKKYEKKIKGLNRWLARAKSGSKNRYKIKRKLQTVYKKLKNARKFLLHSISKELTDDNDIIVSENLHIKNMVQNKHLSKSILDASWSELIRQLKYKCIWKNKRFYQVDTYYPSSQICSRCGYKESKVKDLSVRAWECPNCTNKNNRDLNASINIMFEGVKMYMERELKELQVN